MENTAILPACAEIRKINPGFILFSSLEILRSSQVLMGDLSDMEIQTLVCTAIGEEASARELGADHCIFHPVTYENFCDAVTSNRKVYVKESGLNTNGSGFYSIPSGHFFLE